MIKYIYWNSCFCAVYVYVSVLCMNTCGGQMRTPSVLLCYSLLNSFNLGFSVVSTRYAYLFQHPSSEILSIYPNTPGFLLRPLRFELRSSQLVHLTTEPTSQLLDLHFKKKISIIESRGIQFINDINVHTYSQLQMCDSSRAFVQLSNNL